LQHTEGLTEEVKEIVRGLESDISEPEQINIEADSDGFLSADLHISEMQSHFYDDSYGIISQIPGVLDDFDVDYQATIPFSRVLELLCDPRTLQLIRPRQTLKSICSLAPTLRNILEGQGDADACIELQNSLKKFHSLVSWRGDEMKRQLWPMEDLAYGGGLGFTVELFFLALSQLLSTSPSKEAHFVLYTGTFRVITSDRSDHKHSLGTQKLLLAIAVSRIDEFSYRYPDYIVDEFLSLLNNIFEGQTGPHIDEARQHIESERLYSGTRYKHKVLKILTRGQAQTPAS
jgi:hypothetical protein